jgi:hypothetical protein
VVTRQELIEELRQHVEEGRAEIERRRGERESNLFLMDDYLREERQQEELVMKDAGSSDLIYKTTTAPPPANGLPETIQPDGFTELQAEALMHVIAELRREVEDILIEVRRDIVRLDNAISDDGNPVSLPRRRDRAA